MIEFNGYISGQAERHYWKMARRFGVLIMYIAITLVFPFILLIYFGLKSSIALNVWEIPVCYSFLYIIVPLFTLIPKSKADKLKYNPRKIFTDGEYLVLITGNGEETHKLISDAKELIDHGEFYEVIFSIATANNSFICQKKLISVGTLEEFESLFEGKIRKKDSP